MKEEYIKDENIDEVADRILAAVRPYERPYDFNLNKDEVALLIIDMQKFFFDPGAHGFIPSAGAIVPNIRALQEFFLKNNLPVFLTKHINDKENAGMMGIRWKETITENHPFVDIVPEIEVPGCRIIQKSQFDAFFGTRLERLLKDNGVKQLVIAGVMANVCCETTVRSAFVRGFEPFMPVDATAAYNYQFHLSTFNNLAYGFMQTLTTAQIIDLLKM